jgi:hypothetical protein
MLKQAGLRLKTQADTAKHAEASWPAFENAG